MNMDTEAVVQTAKGISDFGMLAMTAAMFLVMSMGMIVTFIRMFKSMVGNIINRNAEQMAQLHEAVNRNWEAMVDIAEGLRPETMMQIKNISGVYFDLATEKVCRIIKRVRTENNIANREATRAKIHKLLKIQHDDRNSRFDCHTYRGRKLSEYCDPSWIDWVAEVVEAELYNEAGANNGRAYNNVHTVYDSIKADFYKNLQGFHIELNDHQ